MMEIGKFFNDLKKTILSAESDTHHGRGYQGQRKLVEAHNLITEYLGDNLPTTKAERFVRHIETHIARNEGGTNQGDSVMCKICEKTIDEIDEEGFKG